MNHLPVTFYSQSRARLRHARALHGWIYHNHVSKTPLLKILKTSMDHSVASCLHGIRITAEQGLSKILIPWNRKWQAKQEWHNSAINSTMPSRMQQETKLLHSNIATKHKAVMYSRCLTKHEHWATAKSQKSRFKEAWQKCKRYQHHRLGENTNMPGITAGSHI